MTLLLISVSLSTDTAFGEIIINEVEMSPPTESPHWIEIRNLAERGVRIDNLEVQIVSNSTTAGVVWSVADGEKELGPNEYKIIHFNGNLEEMLNLPFDIILINGQKTIDSAHGLNDNFSDEKTWQRFPDSIDTGDFEDWTFREDSKGEENGNIGQVVAECSLDPFCWGGLDVFFHNSHNVTVDKDDFLVKTFYDSRRINIDFDQDRKIILVNMKSNDFSEFGPTASFLHVSIPKNLMSGTFSVFVDGDSNEFHVIDGPLANRLIVTGLGDIERIEITGTKVIPEFSWGVLVILSILILTILVIQRQSFGRFFLGYKPA